jgi:hypothetical protein
MADFALQDGDEVIVIAEDDDSYTPLPAPVSGLGGADVGSVPRMVAKDDAEEHLMLVGWRRDLDDMVTTLDDLCNPGTDWYRQYRDTILLVAAHAARVHCRRTAGSRNPHTRAHACQ